MYHYLFYLFFFFAFIVYLTSFLFEFVVHGEVHIAQRSAFPGQPEFPDMLKANLKDRRRIKERGGNKRDKEKHRGYPILCRER